MWFAFWKAIIAVLGHWLQLLEIGSIRVDWRRLLLDAGCPGRRRVEWTAFLDELNEPFTGKVFELVRVHVGKEFLQNASILLESLRDLLYGPVQRVRH
jgi:hypothetical protein